MKQTRWNGDTIANWKGKNFSTQQKLYLYCNRKAKYTYNFLKLQWWPWKWSPLREKLISRHCNRLKKFVQNSWKAKLDIGLQKVQKLDKCRDEHRRQLKISLTLAISKISNAEHISYIMYHVCTKLVREVKNSNIPAWMEIHYFKRALHLYNKRK